MSKLVFVDDVADQLQVEHATVVVLEKDHSVMDIIRWIETGTVQVRNYDVVVCIVGRADVSRSRGWFLESIEEFRRAMSKLHPQVVVVAGAVIPSVLDTIPHVKEFLARNSLLQKKAEEVFRRWWYIRPGRVVLVKGSPVLDFFGRDNRLNEKGRQRIGLALQRDLDQIMRVSYSKHTGPER